MDNQRPKVQAGGKLISVSDARLVELSILELTQASQSFACNARVSMIGV